jgi:hypothetical protein
MNDKIENKYKEYHNSNKNDGKINSIRTALADEAFNAAEDTPRLLYITHACWRRKNYDSFALRPPTQYDF